MADVFHRNFFLAGPVGRLEALLWTTPESSLNMAALVCHPHPLFGGTMHNKVVFQVAKALHGRGMPVLRFNFRGAGLSSGEYDHGRGEQEDVRMALDYLAEQYTGSRILLAGFSFGSWVGLRAGCQHTRVADLAGLGLPIDKTDLTFLRACEKPKLIIQGENDQYGSRANVEALFGSLSDPKRLVIVKGADHFFTGKLEQVGAAIGNWLDERYPRAGNVAPV